MESELALRNLSPNSHSSLAPIPNVGRRHYLVSRAQKCYVRQLGDRSILKFSEKSPGHIGHKDRVSAQAWIALVAFDQGQGRGAEELHFSLFEEIGGLPDCVRMRFRLWI